MKLPPKFIYFYHFLFWNVYGHRECAVQESSNETEPSVLMVETGYQKVGKLTELLGNGHFQDFDEVFDISKETAQKF